MPNLNQQAEQLKNVPDQALQQELQKPAVVPPFLTMSEIQRRQQTRQQAQAAQGQQQSGSVYDDVVRSMMARMPPKGLPAPPAGMVPMGNAAPIMPGQAMPGGGAPNNLQMPRMGMAMAPRMMARGGLHFQDGGDATDPNPLAAQQGDQLMVNEAGQGLGSVSQVQPQGLASAQEVSPEQFATMGGTLPGAQQAGLDPAFANAQELSPEEFMNQMSMGQLTGGGGRRGRPRGGGGGRGRGRRAATGLATAAGATDATDATGGGGGGGRGGGKGGGGGGGASKFGRFLTALGASMARLGHAEGGVIRMARGGMRTISMPQADGSTLVYMPNPSGTGYVYTRLPPGATMSGVRTTSTRATGPGSRGGRTAAQKSTIFKNEKRPDPAHPDEGDPQHFMKGMWDLEVKPSGEEVWHPKAGGGAGGRMPWRMGQQWNLNVLAQNLQYASQLGGHIFWNNDPEKRPLGPADMQNLAAVAPYGVQTVMWRDEEGGTALGLMPYDPRQTTRSAMTLGPQGNPVWGPVTGMAQGLAGADTSGAPMTGGYAGAPVQTQQGGYGYQPMPQQYAQQGAQLTPQQQHIKDYYESQGLEYTGQAGPPQQQMPSQGYGYQPMPVQQTGGGYRPPVMPGGQQGAGPIGGPLQGLRSQQMQGGPQQGAQVQGIPEDLRPGYGSGVGQEYKSAMKLRQGATPFDIATRALMGDPTSDHPSGYIDMAKYADDPDIRDAVGTALSYTMNAIQKNAGGSTVGAGAMGVEAHVTGDVANFLSNNMGFGVKAATAVQKASNDAQAKIRALPEEKRKIAQDMFSQSVNALTMASGMHSVQGSSALAAMDQLQKNVPLIGYNVASSREFLSRYDSLARDIAGLANYSAGSVDPQVLAMMEHAPNKVANIRDGQWAPRAVIQAQAQQMAQQLGGDPNQIAQDLEKRAKAVYGVTVRDVQMDPSQIRTPQPTLSQLQNNRATNFGDYLRANSASDPTLAPGSAQALADMGLTPEQAARIGPSEEQKRRAEQNTPLAEIPAQTMEHLMEPETYNPATFLKGVKQSALQDIERQPKQQSFWGKLWGGPGTWGAGAAPEEKPKAQQPMQQQVAAAQGDLGALADRARQMQAQGQPPQQYYPQQQQPQQYYPQQQPQQYEQQQAVQPQMTQDERRELEAYRAQQRRAEESARREQEQAAAAVQQQQAQAPAPAPEPEVRQPEFGSWGNAAKGGAIRLQTGGSAPTTGGTASQTPAAFTATPQTTGLSADALARNQAGWMASGKMTQDQYNQAWQNWNAISQGPGIIPAAGASNPSTSTPSASTTSTSAATSQPQQAGSSLTPAQMTTTAALTPEQQTQAGAGLRMRMQPSLGFDPYSILAPQTRQRGGTILDRSPSRRQVLGSIR